MKRFQYYRKCKFYFVIIEIYLLCILVISYNITYRLIQNNLGMLVRLALGCFFNQTVDLYKCSFLVYKVHCIYCPSSPQKDFATTVKKCTYTIFSQSNIENTITVNSTNKTTHKHLCTLLLSCIHMSLIFVIYIGTPLPSGGLVMIQVMAATGNT